MLQVSSCTFGASEQWTNTSLRYFERVASSLCRQGAGPFGKWYIAVAAGLRHPRWYPGEPDIQTSLKLVDRSAETRGALFQSRPTLPVKFSWSLWCDMTQVLIALLYFFSEERMQDPCEEVETSKLAQESKPRLAQAAGWARWTTLCHYQGSNPNQYSNVFHVFVRFLKWICDLWCHSHTSRVFLPSSSVIHALARRPL